MSSSKPLLWEQIRDFSEKQHEILNSIEKLQLSLNGLDKVLSKLSEIALKTDKLIDSISKIDVNKLELTLNEVNSKIPSIEPLLAKLGKVINVSEAMARELGIE